MVMILEFVIDDIWSKGSRIWVCENEIFKWVICSRQIKSVPLCHIITIYVWMLTNGSVHWCMIWFEIGKIANKYSVRYYSKLAGYQIRTKCDILCIATIYHRFP